MNVDRAFRWLVGPGRVPFLVLVAAITLFLAREAVDAPLDRSAEALRADDPVATEAARKLRTEFPGGETVLLTWSRDDLLSAASLTEVARLTDRIRVIPGVLRVDSLTTAVELVPGPFGAESRPIVPPVDVDPDAVRAALARNAYLDGLLVSADRTTAGWIIELDPDLAPDAVDELRGVVALHDPDGTRAHLTGMAIQKLEVARLVGRDRRVLLPVSVAALAAALGFALRRRSAVGLPLLVTGIAVVWTLGVHGATGHAVNVVTSLLPLLLMTVSVSSAVHVYVSWSSPDLASSGSLDRARAAVRVLAGPCFLTAWTTALGLLSLLASDLPAVRELGLFGALGVGISFCLNVTLLPLLLSRLASPDHRPVSRGRRLDAALRTVASIATGRPKTVLALTAAVVVLAGLGITRVRNNTDLVAFLKADERLVRDTRFVDARLGGASSLDLMIERLDGAPGVLGLPDLLRAVHRAETSDPNVDVPGDAGSLQTVFDLLAAAEDPRPVERLVTAERTLTRLLVRTESLGSANAAPLFEQIHRVAGDALGTGYRTTAAGPFHELVTDSNALVGSLARSAVFALVAVLASIAVQVRSARMLLAATVPNVVPVVATFGFMGFAGIDLSTGTAMIASVVLGIAVDDTIHWIARYRRTTGPNVSERVLATTRSVGRPLTIASAVLAVGFWVGGLGSFWPTIYFSVLTGATILGALVCDLMVLPACLVLLNSQRSLSPQRPSR